MADIQAATIDDIARILERSNNEISTLLKDEFKIIQEDSLEKSRYPSTYEDFKDYAIKNIAEVNKDPKLILTLKKLIDREGPRRFYFFSNELEAISRIFTVIENTQHYILDISSLGLVSLPPILKKAKSVEILNISNNSISDINLLPSLSNLKELNANINSIENITPLQKNKNLEVLFLNGNNIKTTYEVLQTLPKLRVLELVNNRINDILVKPILMNPSLEEINLNNNPLDCPNTILVDLIKLREYYGIDFISTQDNNNVKQNKEEIRGTATIVEPIMNIEEKVSASDKSDATIEKTKEEEKENKIEEDFPSSATGRIAIMATPLKVLLDVERLSKIFFDFIADCEDNSEQFFGLFGRWGRGKTYLWNYIKKHHLKDTRYIPVEFHAWKYQDTPGLWAYLYGELNKKYFGEVTENKKGVGEYIAKTKRLLRLNFVRGKILKPLFIFLFSVIASTIAFLAIKTNTSWLENKYVLIPSLLGLVGVNLLTLFNYLEKYKNGAKEVISQITSNMDFKSQLGLQHEIQEELKLLLSAWIPKDQIGKKRILLFVDDIDRCSEDKIIQIVDYIRVLINDDEIQARITILAAIDERILINAIQNKYRRFVESKDNDATYKELCREYMDKLFIAGLKLGPLTDFEKGEMVKGFTDRYIKKEEELKQEMQTPSVPEDKIEVPLETSVGAVPNTPKGIIPGQHDPNGTRTTRLAPPTNIKEKEAESKVEKKETENYSLEKWEQDFLKEIVEQNSEITPRSIRVYSYRYLLGKKLIEKPLVEGELSWKQWYNRKDAKRCFALKLFHYTYRSNLDELYAKYGAFMKNYKDDNFIREDIYNFSLTLNQKLGSIMYQTLTMIVAY